MSGIKPIELGTKYERLTVICQTKYRDTKGHVKYLCKCNCGNERLVSSYNLRKGVTKSCGCLASETRIKNGKTFRNSKRYKYPSEINGRYYQYTRNSKMKNLEFNLTRDEFSKIIMSDCIYCGRKYTNKVPNGVDRVNSNIGYRLNNCVPCCKICNYAKRTMTVDEFKNWIYMVYNHIYGENKK